jgi:hypothetical protein
MATRSTEPTRTGHSKKSLYMGLLTLPALESQEGSGTWSTQERIISKLTGLLPNPLLLTLAWGIHKMFG